VIYFYPDGKNSEVSGFTAFASKDTEVHALFELTIQDQSDAGKRHRFDYYLDRSLESGPYTLRYRGSMCWAGACR
jgi:hypothetical protein